MNRYQGLTESDMMILRRWSEAYDFAIEIELTSEEAQAAATAVILSRAIVYIGRHGKSNRGYETR